MLSIINNTVTKLVDSILLGKNFNPLLITAFSLYYIPPEYALPEGVYLAWQFSLCLVSLASFVLYVTKREISRPWIFATCAFVLYYAVSKVANASDGTWASVVFMLLRGVGFISLAGYCMKVDFRKTIEALLTASVVMCAVHYATFLLYGGVYGGMRAGYVETQFSSRPTNQHWLFLSHDNGSVFYFLPMLALLWFYILAFRRKMLPVGVMVSIASIYMYVSLWSATAMVSTIFLCFGSVLLFAINKDRTWSSAICVSAGLLGLIGCLVVVFLNVNGLFESVAVLLGKSGTANSRALIWQKAIAEFARKPLFGVGYELNETSFLRLGINHCHNIIIQILYTGGISSLSCFVAALLSVFPKKKIQTASIVFGVYMLAFFLSATFDWYLYMTIAFAPFVVMYGYEKYGDPRTSGGRNHVTC